MFTKQHFKATADMIRHLPKANRQAYFDEWCQKFITSNIRFSEEKFAEACGIAHQPSLKQVQKQTRYQVCFSDIVPWKKLGKDIIRIDLGNQRVRTTEYVRQSRYGEGHAWAGQVHYTQVSVSEMYARLFPKSDWRIGGGSDYCGMVCAGSSFINVCDFISDCLFQVEGAEDTEACTNLMGPWIAYEVDGENIPKFEKSLAYHLDILKAMKFTCSTR